VLTTQHLYPQKLALTSPTSGGLSVGVVRSRTKATEFFFFVMVNEWKRIQGCKMRGARWPPLYQSTDLGNGCWGTRALLQGKEGVRRLARSGCVLLGHLRVNVERGVHDTGNVIVWWVLRKRLHSEAYRLFRVLALSVNVFVTLATQQHLEYRCKSLFETPCITNGSPFEP
jgi:hypothetical protein